MTDMLSKNCYKLNKRVWSLQSTCMVCNKWRDWF